MSINAPRVVRKVVATGVMAGLLMAVPAVALAAPKPKTPDPVITSAPSSPSSSAAASFSFTDSLATATFSCSLDGAGLSSCTSPKSYTGLSEGVHTFRVRATAPGRKPSNTISRSWTVDVSAPAAPTVSQPTTPRSSPTVSLTFSSASTDVTGYQCAVDGGAASACSSPVTVAPAGDGLHQFSVTAVDGVGHSSPTTTVHWSVDSSTPAPVVNSAPATQTTATSANFAYSSTEQGVAFACSLDNAAFAACTSGQQSYSSLAVGGHTFQVRATDTVGNTAFSPSYAWTVVNSSPITLGWSDPASLPPAQSHLGTASFGFDLSGQTTVACRLDSVALPTCASPQAVSGLSDGLHVFQLVVDSGLPTEVILQHSWTVDTVGPSAPIVSGPSGVVANTSASVSVTATDATAALTCAVDGSPVGCTSPVDLTNLAQGGHTFTATATDQAGNTASGTASWTVDTVAPLASVTVPSLITNGAKVSFNEGVGNVSGSSVLLQTSTGSKVASTLTCADGADAAMSCGLAGVRKVSLMPTKPLVPGERYQVVVNKAGAATVVDVAGNTAANSVRNFRGALRQEEKSPAAAWTWRKVVAKSAKGGSYTVEHRRGASASWSFSGTAVSWLTVKGPRFGVGDVYVDGKKKASFNNYAASNRYGVVRTVRGLTAGSHTVKVFVTGKKGSTRGLDTQVAVDGFKIGSKLYATPALKTAWARVATAKASGGGFVRADLAGASVAFTFRGTGVSWLTETSRWYGKAAVYIDGKKVRTVDNYSSVAKYRVARAFTGLADKRHTVKVVALGTHRAGAKGNYVAVDGWVVR